MRVKKLLSLAMIYLVLSITLTSPLAMATIFSAEIHGQDEAPGAVRSDDNVVIRTESTMPCSVKADFTQDFYEQMNCGSGTPLSCAYTIQLSNISGMISATVKESGSGDLKTVEAYVDENPPSIDSLAISSMGNKAKASFTMSDTGNDIYPSKCAGIKKVELFLNNQLANTTTYEPGQCSLSASITGMLDDYMGKVNTSIKAYDYMEHPANRTGSQVYIDSRIPEISSVKIYKPGTEQELKKISTESEKELRANLVIIVKDNAIPGAGAVKANLTQLNGDEQTASANCRRQGWNQSYECTVRDIAVKPETASPQIIIYAQDTAGNQAEEMISLSFEIVNDPGTVTRLGPAPEKCIDNKCYLKKGLNNITAVISTSSSYNESNVMINNQQAECRYEGGWKCTAMVSMDSGRLELTGYDDLGNYISAETELDLVVDGAAPRRTGEVLVEPDCPTSSETLLIQMNVIEKESPNVIIRADTERISENNQTEVQCAELEDDNYECRLEITSLKNRELNTNLNVLIEDTAGNQLKESVPVSICVKVDEIPDLIDKIVTRGKLPKVDRKVASRITVKAPIGLKIIKKQADVEIIERSIVDCSDTPGVQGQAYMINNDGLKPVMIIPLHCQNGESCMEDWNEDGKVKIKCTQEFMIKHGNKLYTNPEPEEITAELEVYNQALGTINESFEKKISKIKEELVRLDKQIKKYEGIHEYLGTICNLAEGLGRVNQLLQSAKQALWLICVAIPGLGDAVWTPIHTALSGYQNFVDTNIWPQGWIPTGGNTIGLIVKGTCSIYTCKTYDFNTYIDIGMSIAAHHATKDNKNKIVDKREMCDTTTGQCGKAYIYSDGSVEWEGKPDKIFSLPETNLPNNILVDQGYIDEILLSMNPATELSLSELLPKDILSALEPKGIVTVEYKMKGTTGHTTADPTNKKGFFSDVFKPFSSESFALFNSETRMQNALDAFMGDDGNWVYNPYKSKHYDSLCMPAILFNDRKERELLCKRLGCLQYMAETGGPLEACESDYELGMCMYVESARYKLEGGATFFKILKNSGRIFLSNAVGIGVTAGYLFAVPGCVHYQTPGGFTLDYGGTLKGTKAVACGLMGSLLSAREITAFIANPYNPIKGNAPVELPAEGAEFCSKVNYDE